MESIGLVPSDTGKPNGKKTGQHMTHYILDNGLFDITSKPLLTTTILYQDQPRDEAIVKKKNASKTKFTCPNCDFNAWCKPNSKVFCGNCNESEPIQMKSEEQDEI